MLHIRSIAGLLAVSAVVIAPHTAPASPIGLKFSYTSVTFDYQPAPGPGGKVGEIALSLPGILTLSKYDLGGDGFGGGNDVLLSSAVISSSAAMGFALAGDVYQVGANDYLISGFLGGTDVDQTSNSHEAILDCSNVAYIPAGPGGALAIAGLIAAALPNDSILINRDDGGEDWDFIGTGEADGGVSIDSGRAGFGYGTISLVQPAFNLPGDLDNFFSDNRTYTGGDLKINVVPEPATISVLVFGGLGVVASRRRRSA